MRLSKKRVVVYFVFGIPVGLYFGIMFGVANMTTAMFEEFNQKKNSIDKIIWYSLDGSLDICVEGYLLGDYHTSYLIRVPIKNDVYYLQKNKRSSISRFNEAWMKPEDCAINKRKEILFQSENSFNVLIQSVTLNKMESIDVVSVDFEVERFKINHKFNTFTSIQHQSVLLEEIVLVLSLVIDVMI